MDAVSTLGWKAEFGRKIELIYKEEFPGKIELNIINNRGAIKDTLIISLNDFLDKANIIKVMSELYLDKK